MSEQSVVAVEQRGALRRGGKRRPASLGRPRGEMWWAYLLIAPTALGLGLFTIWPAFQTFYFSFTTWGAFGGHTWSGLTNYVQVLHDPEFGQSLINTFIFTAMAMISVPLSIVVAALLNRRGLRGIAVYRTIYFLPVVTLPAAVALVWGMLYNGDFGVVNWVLSLFGIHGPSWMSDPSTAIFALGIVAIWGAVGYNMVLFLAGMQSIPRDYYEAAALDGAGKFRQFFGITLPLLTPTTFFVTVITVINSLQVFDLVYLMVGPTSPALQHTETVIYLFYQKGFVEGNGGYASATAFVLLAIIVVFTVIQFRMQKKWVHYE
jgi:multiple sugar transport system permease protein